MKEIFSRGIKIPGRSESYGQNIRDYFTLKDIFLDNITTLHYKNESYDFMNFLKVYDTNASIMKQRVKNGKMWPEISRS